MNRFINKGRGLVTKFLLAFICASFATGCMSVHQEAERIHFSRHPMHATQMSAQPQEGFVPCGVWRVRGAHNTVYLAGTSHIVATNQVPFPSPFYAAYQDSREIFVEVETASFLTTLRLLPKVWKWTVAHRDELSCPADRTLADYLSPQTLEKLHARYGRDFKQERMTPLMLLLVSETEEMSGQGGENGGVEDVFTLSARKDGKPIRELDDKEIAGTAMTMLDEMLAAWRRDIAQRGADAVIQENLLDDDNSEDDLVWRRGDMAAVEKVHAEIKKEVPAIFDSALPDRNRKWMVKLKAALQGRRNVMALVGVAHLGGKEGLLQLLQDAGFKPEQMYGVDRPSR